MGEVKCVYDLAARAKWPTFSLLYLAVLFAALAVDRLVG